MPMCHANSPHFMRMLTYCDAPVHVCSRASFDPDHLLRTLADGDITFTSRVPTHYVMMLGLGETFRAAHLPERVTRPMISSAPARHDIKQAILDWLGLLDLPIIDVRDEGTAVHMAHAHVELTGELGVAMATAGPSVINCVTAIASASLARVPVLLIGGCPPRPQVNMGSLQDIPHVDILAPVTRHSRMLRPCSTW